jgi:hypothetical protein
MVLVGALAMSLTACSTPEPPAVEYEERECLMDGSVTSEAGSYSAEGTKVAQLKQIRDAEIHTGYVFAMAFSNEAVKHTLTVIVPFDRDGIVARVEAGAKEPVVSRADLIYATNLGESLERTGDWNFPESGETGGIEGKVIVSESEEITLDLFMLCPLPQVA